MKSISLEQALTDMANYFSLDPKEVIAYAEEDDIGGYHSNPALEKWPVGSLWEVEGKMLYAYIRATKPSSILEIGTFKGVSALHILSALSKNSKGILSSLDIWEGAGEFIPKHLHDIWYFFPGDALDFLWETKDTNTHYDMVFEDGPHSFEFTRNAIRLVRDYFFPKAIFSHDAAHFLVGKDVTAGFENAVNGPIQVALIEPSDCGIGYWKP